jgi:hypothetical protein
MKWVAAALLAVSCAAAADEDPVDVLMRLRDQVVEHSERIPNYLCVETVYRDRYDHAGDAPKTCDDIMAGRNQPGAPQRLRLAATDRLRLDVALADGREIYSWAGAAKFEEGEIDELIPDGAMGTGPFATMLLSVFQGRPPKFLFEGDTVLDHRLVYQYSYSVPREESRYRVRAKREWVITAYDATLWVDPKTAELVRLEVRTDELPPATTLCQTNTTLEYGMVQLAGNDYLLPKLAKQRFIGRDGGESVNQTTFAACREFRGESTLRFGAEHGGTAASPIPRPASAALPAGLEVAIDLAGDIDDHAAAGDMIRGRVAKPVRTSTGAALVPEGAPAEGRLMRVEIRHGSKPEAVLSLRWETLDGRPVALLPRRKLADIRTIAGLPRRGVEIELPPASDARYGVYHFAGEHVSVMAGFRTEWTTAHP